MATTYYLNSTGSNTAPYDTAAKGALDLDVLDALALVNGDLILMAKVHVESWATLKVWDNGLGRENPVIIRRVDTAAGDVYAPSTGSDTKNIKTTTANDDMTFDGYILQGVAIEVTGDILLGAGPSNIFVDCWLLGTGNNKLFDFAGTSVGFSIKNCIVEGLGTLGLDSGSRGQAGEWLGNTFIGVGARAGGLIPISNGRARFADYTYCDFTGVVADDLILVDCSQATTTPYSIQFIGCIFPVTVTTFSITDSVTPGSTFGKDVQHVITWNSSQGVDTFPAYDEGFRGTIEADDVTYRDAGWVDADQDTNLSHSMQASATACFPATPLQSFDITQWNNTTGTFTITVECIENYTTALQNDEAWMEVYYLDDTTAKMTRATTQVNVQDTTADLTAGTGLANWTGEPASSRSVKFSISGLTIGKKGLITVRIFLGKFESGKEFFYDPMMTIA